MSEFMIPEPFSRAIESMGGEILLLCIGGGEQPDSSALPVDGTLRGEHPLSKTERSEV